MESKVEGKQGVLVFETARQVQQGHWRMLPAV